MLWSSSQYRHDTAYPQLNRFQLGAGSLPCGSKHGHASGRHTQSPSVSLVQNTWASSNWQCRSNVPTGLGFPLLFMHLIFILTCRGLYFMHTPYSRFHCFLNLIYIMCFVKIKLIVSFPFNGKNECVSNINSLTTLTLFLYLEEMQWAQWEC